MIREEKIRRLLILVSNVACVTISIIYILMAIVPIYYFHGYVRGYYSILDYRLYYAYGEQPVSMPHTDYIRHVSVTFTLLSAALLSLSIISIALVWLNPLAASGLIYGASAGLTVLYGLLSGYILRAVSLDMGRFSYLMRNLVVFRTLAGTITFEGVRLEQTFIHWLALSTPLLIILLAVAALASCAAVTLSLHAIYGRAVAEGMPSGWGRGLRQISAYTALSLLAFTSLASVFVYYPSTIAVSPQPPPATLEAPPYLYTCTDLTRTSRGALTYTDFETYPSGWTSYGGEWQLFGGGGFRGNALRGRDNNGGVGRITSQYYWNTRIDGYTSLWVSVRTRAEQTDDGYKGIGLLNAGRNRLYEISVQSTATIYKWDGAWRLLGSIIVPGYSATRWYTLILRYTVTTTTVIFELHIYDDTGTLVASLTASDTGGTRFTPAYAGVTIDAATNLWFMFEDFIVSTVDPRSISFAGFRGGMSVEVWDNLGNLVNSTAAPSSSFSLRVTRDVVVGTGVDGRIVVKCPDGYPCGVLTVPTSDAILGGDAYSLATGAVAVSLGANKTSSAVTIYISGSSLFSTTASLLRVNSSQVLYARLILDSISAPSALNADIWLEGFTKSTSITIESGAPISASTSIIRLNLGLNNSIILTGYFSATGQTATLYLRLELRTAEEGLGVCIYYPIRLDIASS
ncbi:MAG: hypothetical protein QW294_06065 [Candidatus Bathyarchaeia archaeon]